MLDSVRGLHVVLLIGLAWVVESTTQKCIYNDELCSCRHDTVSCQFLTGVPVIMPGNYTWIRKIKFNHSNITRITKTTFPPRLKSINLHTIPLTYVSDNAFDLSATSLQTLLIFDVKLTTLPKALLRLKALETLRIEDMPIQNWNNATLKPLSSKLTYLLLRNVNLATWPRWLSSFTKLDLLDLSYNSITYIPDDAFNAMRHRLGNLGLENTGLVRLPQSITSLSVLHTLNLANNKFENVTATQERLAALWLQQALLSINLALNDLRQLPKFVECTNLEKIDVSRNLIGAITVGSLPHILKVAIFSDNLLDDIPPGIGNLKKLSNVSLQGNRIANLRPEAFPPSLTYINLGHNGFSYIGSRVFRRLFHLETLHLDYTELNYIEHQAFDSLKSLKLLTLTRTHLWEVPLAFITLKPEIDIQMTTVSPVTCVCPPNEDLVGWYAKLTTPTLASVNCTNGLRCDEYLTGHCSHPSRRPPPSH